MPREQILERDEKHGIVYRILTPDDVEEAIDAMSDAFYHDEPCTGPTVSAWSLKDWKIFVRFFIPRMAVEGNTVIAVDEKTGKVAGGFINEDFANPQPVELLKFYTISDGDTRPWMACIEELEHHLLQNQGLKGVEDLCPGEWLHLWMLGVRPEYRKRGIATKATEHSLKWAKSRGFKLSFAETTGAFSTRIMKNKFKGKLDIS